MQIVSATFLICFWNLMYSNEDCGRKENCSKRHLENEARSFDDWNFSVIPTDLTRGLAEMTSVSTPREGFPIITLLWCCFGLIKILVDVRLFWDLTNVWVGYNITPPPEGGVAYDVISASPFTRIGRFLHHFKKYFCMKESHRIPLS